MKVFIASFALMVMLTVSANGQISISSDEFFPGLSQPSSNTTSFFSTDLSGLDALITESGPGMSWNIGSRVYTQDAVSTDIKTILNYPGGAALADDSDFLLSTHVIKTVSSDPTKPIQFLFIKYDQTGYWWMGSSQDSAGKLKKISGYSPPLQHLKFPLIYQTAWQTNSTIHSPNTPPNETITNGIDAVVDSYGTLITPTSSHKNGDVSPMASGDVLRVKIRNTSTVTLNTPGHIDTLLNDTVYTFKYYSKSGHSATIAANTNFHALDVSYTVQGNNSVGDNYYSAKNLLNVCFSENPVFSSETKLYYTMNNDANSQVSIMNALGSQIHILQNGQAHAGQNIIPIDVNAISSGTYFIQINAGGLMAIKKLIVAK